MSNAMFTLGRSDGAARLPRMTLKGLSQAQISAYMMGRRFGAYEWAFRPALTKATKAPKRVVSWSNDPTVQCLPAYSR